MDRYKFPCVADFLKLERETFNFLFKAAPLCHHYELHSRIATANTSLQDGAFTVDFEGMFNAEIEEASRRVCLGSKVETDGENYTNISYSFSIFRDCTSPEVLRRVHFDVAVPGQKGKAKHPLYHFHVGGSTTPLLEEYGADLSNIHPWLSQPRWPHYPLNTALFLDMAFRELGDPNLNKFIEGGEWRALVKKSEKEIWRPFHSFAIETIESASENLMDKYYEP